MSADEIATISRRTTFELEAFDVLAYLDEQLALGRARVIGVRDRCGLPCFEVDIPENRRGPIPKRAENLRPYLAEVPCNLRPQWGGLVGRENWRES